MGAKYNRHNNLQAAISLHGFLQKLQGSAAIAPLSYEGFKNFTFVINGSPKIMDLAIDPHENFFQVPSPLR